MSVKRFVAADMRRALQLVREEMGPEAIILSSRRIKQGVEILTTLQAEPMKNGVRAELDRALTGGEVPTSSDGAWSQHDELARAREQLRLPQDSVDNSAQSDFAIAFTEQRGVASGKTPQELAREIELARERMLAARNCAGNSQHSGPDTPPVDPQREREDPQQQQQLQALQSELADMRLLLEEQLSRISHTPQQNSPIHTGLMRRLRHMGFSDAIAEKLVSGTAEHSTVQEAWAATQTSVARQLPVEGTDSVMSGGLFAFVGPTGVGKTTTIAKLAARYVLENGAENVALVTADTYRIAAHDQLRSLGNILGVQVRVVDDNRDLPHVLRSLKGCPLVLVDTAGFRQGDSQLREQLEVLAAVPDLKTLLVMACNSQPQVLKASVHAHQAAGLSGCVLSKLDESACLGEALSVVLEHELTVYYSTDGQEIPQDISVADGQRLVAAALELMTSGMGSLATVSSSNS